jgi:transcription elongation factor GreA
MAMDVTGEQPVLSAEAIEALQAELEELKSTGREKMTDQIRQARELGDVTDNAAYETAKQDQAMLEGRIARLEDVLKNAVVRQASARSDIVTPGLVVTVRDVDDSTIVDSFVLAEPEERVTGARVLSPRSPLGQALLDHKVGDQVTYEAPGGTFTYEVVKIEPA